MKTSSRRQAWVTAVGSVKGPWPGRTATGETRRLRTFPPTSVGPTVPALDDGSLDHLSPIVRHREEQTRLHMWEAQLKRREEELRRREGERERPRQELDYIDRLLKQF